jgi:hypothetical protein
MIKFQDVESVLPVIAPSELTGDVMRRSRAIGARLRQRSEPVLAQPVPADLLDILNRLPDPWITSPDATDPGPAVGRPKPI